MIEESLYRGVIVKGVGGFYYVRTADRTFECHARGKFRVKGVSPIVGDRVVMSVNKEDGTGRITEIEPRKNFLVRPEVANVDLIVLVSAARSPMPDYLLTDKMLIFAESKQIESIICLNKTDLVSDSEVCSFSSVYRSAGYNVIEACAATGEGTDELKNIIKGRTVAFAGLSGVGKSSLLKKITGGEDIKVGSVSRIERGKHTTRHVELMETAGGYVFDTPGFSKLETSELRANDLRFYFPEIRSREGQCRFIDCNHVGEPDCAVAEAVKSGKISESRHKSYVTFFSELNEIKDWQRAKSKIKTV